LALGKCVGLKAVTCKPIVAIACLSLCAVGAVAASLPSNICAVKSSHLEAVFSCLFLCVCGEVSLSQKFVDNALVLTYSPTEHSSVVPIVVNTPLDIHDLSRGVSDDWGVSPIGCWPIVVNADPSIVATRATSTYLGCSEVWPSGNRLKNRAFWAGIYSRLKGKRLVSSGKGWTNTNFVSKAGSTRRYDHVTVSIC
jgi:hypothetical protein